MRSRSPRGLSIPNPERVFPPVIAAVAGVTELWLGVGTLKNRYDEGGLAL